MKHSAAASLPLLVLALFAASCGGAPAPAPAPAPSGAAAPAAGAPSPAPSATPSIGGVVYGRPDASAQQIALSDLVARPEEFDGKTVRVSGIVSGVCEKRGCWMRIAAESGSDDVLFKVADGEIVIPMSAKGQSAVADGIARKVPLTIEQTRDHLAKKAKAAGTPFDPASVTAPISLVRLEGIGATISPTR